MISIIMGSKSDSAVVEKGEKVLKDLGVDYETKVYSAHRTPKELAAYVESLQNRGIKIVIAVAGKAAALPGVVAAHTILPVIGVPVETKLMGGLDSLLSISQMPSGIPVAAMGTGNSGMINAALFACHIIALEDPEIEKAILSYRKNAAESVLEA